MARFRCGRLRWKKLLIVILSLGILVLMLNHGRVCPNEDCNPRRRWEFEFSTATNMTKDTKIVPTLENIFVDGITTKPENDLSMLSSTNTHENTTIVRTSENITTVGITIPVSDDIREVIISGNLSRIFSKSENDLSELPSTSPEVTSTSSTSPTTATKREQNIQNYLNDQNDLCLEDWKNKALPSGKKPLCDCIPKTLLGPLEINLEPMPINKTMPNSHSILPGGHWEPVDCIPRYRVVIVVPFRDRQSHLSVLLRYLHPILQGQQANYTILVIEQSKPDIFNKAALMNVGYHYALKDHNVDCVIFHDVDFIPEDGHHLYRCKHSPLHLGAYYDSYHYKLMYPTMFGAVTAFRPVDFEKVNGFSNHYFGWGGEDDDMSMRVRENFPKILRDPREVAGYKVISHERDSGNRQLNRTAMLEHLFYKRNTLQDGLNSLRFKFKEQILHPLYTWILVDILKKGAPKKKNN